MEWWNQLVRGLGTSNAPFGFAPVDSPSQGQVDPAYNAGMQMLGNVGMGMLASGEKNPMTALGKSYLVASQNAQQQNKDQYVAAKMLEEADAKKQERAREQEKQKWLEDQISQLDPKVQGIARMMPEKFFGAQIEQMFPSPNAGSDQYFGTPIPYDMGDGKIGYGLPSKNGGFKPLEIPGGGSFLGPYDKAYQSSSGTTKGKITTEQEMSAPGDLAAADQAIGIIDQITSHPAIEMGTGFSSYGNAVRGTPGYDFQNLVEQAKSGAFLTAIDQLKGMGALSNMEGQAATAAVTRMDTATSKEAFLKAVADYRAIVERGRMKAQARINGGAAPAASDDPLGLR